MCWVSVRGAIDKVGSVAGLWSNFRQLVAERGCFSADAMERHQHQHRRDGGKGQLQDMLACTTKVPPGYNGDPNLVQAWKDKLRRWGDATDVQAARMGPLAALSLTGSAERIQSLLNRDRLKTAEGHWRAAIPAVAAHGGNPAVDAIPEGAHGNVNGAVLVSGLEYLITSVEAQFARVSTETFFGKFRRLLRYRRSAHGGISDYLVTWNKMYHEFSTDATAGAQIVFPELLINLLLIEQAALSGEQHARALARIPNLAGATTAEVEAALRQVLLDREDDQAVSQMALQAYDYDYAYEDEGYSYDNEAEYEYFDETAEEPAERWDWDEHEGCFWVSRPKGKGKAKGKRGGGKGGSGFDKTKRFPPPFLPGRGKGESAKEAREAPPGPRKFSGECWKCGKAGHMSRDCRGKPMIEVARTAAADNKEGGGKVEGAAFATERIPESVKCAGVTASANVAAGWAIVDLGCTHQLSSDHEMRKVNSAIRAETGENPVRGVKDVQVCYDFAGGESANSTKRIKHDIWLGGQRVTTETNVLPTGSTPYLVGVPQLEDLDTILEIRRPEKGPSTITFKALGGVTRELVKDRSGHFLLNLADMDETVDNTTSVGTRPANPNRQITQVTRSSEDAQARVRTRQDGKAAGLHAEARALGSIEEDTSKTETSELGHSVVDSMFWPAGGNAAGEMTAQCMRNAARPVLSDGTGPDSLVQSSQPRQRWPYSPWGLKNAADCPPLRLNPAMVRTVDAEKKVVTLGGKETIATLDETTPLEPIEAAATQLNADVAAFVHGRGRQTVLIGKTMDTSGGIVTHSGGAGSDLLLRLAQFSSRLCKAQCMSPCPEVAELRAARISLDVTRVTSQANVQSGFVLNLGSDGVELHTTLPQAKPISLPPHGISEFNPRHHLQSNTPIPLLVALYWSKPAGHSTSAGARWLTKEEIAKLHHAMGHPRTKDVVNAVAKAGRLVDAAEVEAIASECKVCVNPAIGTRPRRPTTPGLRATRPMQIVAQDMKEMHYHGRRLFVQHLVDLYSKVRLARAYTTKGEKQALDAYRAFQLHYGVIECHMTDNDPAYCGKAMTQEREANGTRHMTSAPYAPFSNGCIERANAELGVLFERLVKACPQMPLDEVFYCISVAQQERCTASGHTPFELMFGRARRQLYAAEHPANWAGSVDPESELNMRKRALEVAREEATRYRASQDLKQYLHADMLHNSQTPPVGALAWYWQESLAKTGTRVRGWHGPARVVGNEGRTVLLKQANRILFVHQTRVRVVESDPGGCVRVQAPAAEPEDGTHPVMDVVDAPWLDQGTEVVPAVGAPRPSATPVVQAGAVNPPFVPAEPVPVVAAGPPVYPALEPPAAFPQLGGAADMLTPTHTHTPDTHTSPTVDAPDTPAYPPVPFAHTGHMEPGEAITGPALPYVADPSLQAPVEEPGTAVLFDMFDAEEPPQAAQSPDAADVWLKYPGVGDNISVLVPTENDGVQRYSGRIFNIPDPAHPSRVSITWRDTEEWRWDDGDRHETIDLRDENWRMLRGQQQAHRAAKAVQADSLRVDNIKRGTRLSTQAGRHGLLLGRVTYNDITSEEQERYAHLIREAAEKEYQSFASNDCFDIVERATDPKSQNVVQCKTVVKWKKPQIEAKVRMTLRGFEDARHGIFGGDWELHSPTTSVYVVRVLTQLFADRRWTPRSMDVATAFLKGLSFTDGDPELFFDPPAAFREFVGMKPDQICKARKAIYGTNDAPRRFHLQVERIMRALGFISHPTRPCLHLLYRDTKTKKAIAGKSLDLSASHEVEIQTLERNFSDLVETVNYESPSLYDSGHLVLAVCTHVDDFYYGGEPSVCTWFEKQLDETLGIGSKEQGDFKFRGLHFCEVEPGHITIDMEHYCATIPSIPDIPGNCRGHRAERPLSATEHRNYRGSVGAIMWAVSQCRIDGAYRANQAARSLANPVLKDAIRVNRLAEELRTTPLTLHYRDLGSAQRILAVQTDASFRGNADKTSQGGSIQLLTTVGENGVQSGTYPAGILNWSSARIKRAHRSAPGAEWLAISGGIAEADGAKAVCATLWDNVHPSTLLLTDSGGNVDLLEGSTKPQEGNIEGDVLAARQRIDHRILIVRHMSSEVLAADGLTKWAPAATKALAGILQHPHHFVLE